MALLGFIVGFVLFAFPLARKALFLFVGWCILGSGWTIALLSVGALSGIAWELLADEGPEEARG